MIDLIEVIVICICLTALIIYIYWKIEQTIEYYKKKRKKRYSCLGAELNAIRYDPKNRRFL